MWYSNSRWELPTYRVGIFKGEPCSREAGQQSITLLKGKREARKAEQGYPKAMEFRQGRQQEICLQSKSPSAQTWFAQAKSITGSHSREMIAKNIYQAAFNLLIFMVI